MKTRILQVDFDARVSCIQFAFRVPLFLRLDFDQIERPLKELALFRLTPDKCCHSNLKKKLKIKGFTHTNHVDLTSSNE